MLEKIISFKNLDYINLKINLINLKNKIHKHIETTND